MIKEVEMKKKIMVLTGIAILWAGLFWYMSLSEVSSAVRFFSVGVCAGSFMFASNVLFSQSKKGRKCRACDKRGVMAITYGEDEGLCRSCFYKYLPYA